MVWLPTALIASFVGSLLLTFVYAYLYAQEKKQYLRIWSISWGVYTSRYIFELITYGNPEIKIWIIGSQLAALISGVLLLQGTYLFTERRWSTIWTALTGFSIVWVVVFVLLDASVMVYSAPGFLLIAVIYVLTGNALLKTDDTSPILKKVTGYSFIIWGIHKADFPLLRGVAWFAPWGYLISVFLGFVVALGMLLIFFQKNRYQLYLSERELARLNADLETRVSERTVQLENAVRDMESFAYSVSHDLRAPLRAITGFSEILMTDHAGDLNAESKLYLEKIVSNSNRMDELIQDLLMLSRVGRQDLKLQQIDLSQLAQIVFNDLEDNYAPHQSVQFTAHPTREISADLNLMRLLLQNLIANSLKFSQHNEHIEIEFGLHQENGRDNVFYLKDNGIGFNMEYAEKVFMPFQRLHTSDEYEGTGIGLATVRRIVQRHNGKVWVHSEEGEGTTIFFSLNT